MKILGIDPGYGRLGIAIVEKDGSRDHVLFSQCFETNQSHDFPARLGLIVQELRAVLATWQPDLCAIEKLYFQKNKKTAMRVSETRGAILALMAEYGVRISELSPQEIKIAVTGSGRASKGDIARFLPKLVVLPHLPKHDDEYDAIAAGITASRLSTYSGLRS